MKAQWKGQITLALMSIPVALYKATETPKKFEFNQLHVRATQKKGKKGKQEDALEICGRLGIERHCKQCNTLVHEELGNFAKGHEHEPGQYVLVSDDEIKSVRFASSKKIDVEWFVAADEIAPTFFGQSYFVGAEAGGEQPLALLRAIMLKKNVTAIGRVVFRPGREDFVAIEPFEGGLMVRALHYKNEVRVAGEVPAGQLPEPQKQALKLAQQLVDGMIVPFEKVDMPNRYFGAMAAMLERKRLGKAIEVPKETKEAPAVDVMAALVASLGAKNKKKRAA